MLKFTFAFCCIAATLFSLSANGQQNKLEPKWAKLFYRPVGVGSYFVKSDHQNNVYVLVDYDTLKMDTLSLISTNKNSSVLIKFDSAGNINWIFPMQDNARTLRSNDLLIDENGNSFLTGEYRGQLHFNSSVVLDSNKYIGQPNLFLAKINNSGSLDWAKGLQGGGKSSLFNVGNNGIGLKRESNNYYQIGDTMINGFVSISTAIFDGNGNTKATKVISSGGLGSGWTVIGDQNGNLYSIMTLVKDSMIIDGKVIKKANLSKTAYVITKMDNMLNIKWLKLWEGAFRKPFSILLSNRELATDNTGSLYVVMPFTDTLEIEGKQVMATDNQQKFLIAKLDASGSIQWLRQSSSATGGQDGSIVALNNDKLVVLASNNEGRISFDDFKQIQIPALVTLDILTGNALDAQTRFTKQGFYAIGSNAHYGLAGLSKNDGYLVKGIEYKPTGANDLFLVKMETVIITGIGREKEVTTTDNISIYPNPAQNQVSIYIPDSRQSEIKVYSIDGRLVLAKQIQAHEQQTILDISVIKSGIYILRLQSDDGKILNTVLVKQP